MTDKIIVMRGSACIDAEVLGAVAREFGWAVETAGDLREIAAAQASRATGRPAEPAAVLFHRSAFGSCSWLEAVRQLSLALPRVHPIACHGFAEPIDWPGLCEAGAFHSLWLPLKESEVHQSFGFVWEARKRRAKPAQRVQRIAPARATARGNHAQVLVSTAS